MDYIRINIAITPSREIQEVSYKLSQEIAKKTDAYFVLDGKNFFPHITLYSTEYPMTNKNKVLDTVSEIVSHTIPLSVSCEKISTHKGYIDFQLLKTDPLHLLHEEIIEKLNPFRENHLRKKYTDPLELAKYSQEQRDYIKQYGYGEIFNAFRPHITLSRVKDEKAAEEIITTLEFSPFSFTPGVITAHTMGDHGTCTGVIKEFTFQ